MFLLTLVIGLADGMQSSAGVIDDLEQSPYGLIRATSAIVLFSDGTSSDLPAVSYDGTGLNNPSPLRGEHSNDVLEMATIPFDGDSPVTIQYDLGDHYNVNELWLWQYNGEGETDRGLKDFDVVFRDEEGKIVGQMTAEQVEQAIGLDLPASYFCPLAECVRYIDLVIRENYGDAGFVGLSDIAFAGRLKTMTVPEPSSVGLMLIGFLCFVRKMRSTR